MTRALAAINAFAVIFSLIWCVGHSTVRRWDWEFWFALGYTLLAAVNLTYFLRHERRQSRPLEHEPDGDPR